MKPLEAAEVLLNETRRDVVGEGTVNISARCSVEVKVEIRVDVDSPASSRASELGGELEVGARVTVWV